MTSEFIFLQDTQLQEGLIVVASFVDRPPNLGGIARTCEIFGVKALVVANADCVKDKEFQFLSVSADKWLNMLQVFEKLFLKFTFKKMLSATFHSLIQIIFIFIKSTHSLHILRSFGVILEISFQEVFLLKVYQLLADFPKNI